MSRKYRRKFKIGSLVTHINFMRSFGIVLQYSGPSLAIVKWFKPDEWVTMPIYPVQNYLLREIK